MKRKIPTIKEFEESSKIDVKDWPRKCGDILAYALKSGLVDGKLKYGSYVGEVHKDSIFCEYGLVTEIDHFWLELESGEVLDPSRWIITSESPFVFTGESSGEYVGGIDYSADAVLGY